MEYFFGIDLAAFIRSAGYLGLFGIIFAESGILFGLFFPGDSLLFTAGFLASQGYFNIVILTLLAFAGAILGDNVGYAFGKRAGPYLFKKEDSFFFHKDHLLRARVFYERHGGRTLIFARFIPVIRTFAPILAGVGNMRYTVFLFYNFLGGIFWAIGATLLGYFLGTVVPHADRYLLPIIIAIMLTSFLPTIIHILRNKEHRDRMWRWTRLRFSRKEAKSR